jgi:hypothetical protein
VLTYPTRLFPAALAAVFALVVAVSTARAQNCCPPTTSRSVQPTYATELAPVQNQVQGQVYYPAAAASAQASPQSLGQGPCCPFPQGKCPFPQGYCAPPNYCGYCAEPLGNPTPFTPRPLGRPCAAPQGSPQGYLAPSPQFSYPSASAKSGMIAR